MKGWKFKKLGEVSKFQGGSQPPKSQFISEYREGYVRFLQIRDFKSDKHIVYIPISAKNRLCNKSDIMIGRYGASVGQILSGRDGAYNVALIKTTPNEKIIACNFFFFYLNSSLFQQKLMFVSDRSAQAGFSKEDISLFDVPLPPLSEQKQIVEILDEAFEAINIAIKNTKQNLANARELFDSYLNAIFIQKGDGWYESFGLDFDLLDPLFLEDVESQMEVFGGTLFDPPSYEGFFQTDREGRPKGVIVLDPKEMITQSGGQSWFKTNVSTGLLKPN